MKTELATIQTMQITDMMTMAKTFADSGMFVDMKSAAQAFVKIQAGQEIGVQPFAAMSGIHIIKGKPTIGAGLIAARVKGSGKYDYKVIENTEKNCSIDFYQGKEKIGNSSFSIEEAKKAGTQNLDKFPKNMLFARAISNGVKWYTPDVFSGPVYTPEEMESVTEDILHVDVTPSLNLVKIGSAAFNSAVKAIRDGRTIEKVEEVANGKGLTFDSEEVKSALQNAVEEAA